MFKLEHPECFIGRRMLQELQDHFMSEGVFIGDIPDIMHLEQCLVRLYSEIGIEKKPRHKTLDESSKIRDLREHLRLFEDVVAKLRAIDKVTPEERVVELRRIRREYMQEWEYLF